VDADLANNTLGWQWVAGCGADAAPYFRIFNPLSQSRKFDPDGAYLRHWLPQLAALAGDAVHEPPPSSGYPPPILDLRQAREAALARYAEIRK
ncbi:MAG: FAD-binding domain-containing protein, partial [Gammaproteobacteria bacterium]